MSSSASGTVLIVEDDRGLGSLMQKHLSRAGLSTLLTHSGADAINVLAGQAVDLMLLDLGLPDMAGTELIRVLAQRELAVPFIVVTGRGDFQLAVNLMKSGARDYLVKDTSLLDLLPSVVLQTFEQLTRDRRLAQAEQKIRDQNRFLENVLNSLSHPLYVIDADSYRIEMANDAARQSQRTAFASQSAVAGWQSELVDEAGVNSPIEEVKRTGKPMALEHVHYDAAGQVSMHEIHIYPVFDDASRVRQVIEYDLDVTTRKRAEQALRESEARLRQVIESLPIVLTSHEPSGRPILIMGAVDELLGADIHPFGTQTESLYDIVHPDDRAYLRELGANHVTEGRAFQVDFRILRGPQRQQTAWLHAQVVPIRDEEGTLIRIDSLLVDKTQEKRMAEERERIEAHLQQTQKLESLGILAGGIAHDFNNLLTIISGNAQFLRESLVLEPAEDKALSDIETATLNASEMTRSLQAFSRPSKPQVSALDANVLVRDVYRLLRRLIPVRIEFDLLLDTNVCMIAADGGQMQQMLINLCVNARDAIAGHGRLQLRTRRVERADLPARLVLPNASTFVEIEVSDNGCGMDNDVLRHAFDPFFTTKTKDQGTGLGLTIVYNIVQSHGGVVDLQSAPGSGTQFRLYFPASTQACAEPPPVAKKAARGTERILVLDDETMIASLIQTLLESSGYTVCVAHRPEEALALAEAAREPVELAIIDCELPGMNGIECLSRLRQKWPALKAVLITGYTLDENTPELQNAHVLHKPFSSHEITRVVRERLDAER